LNKRLQSFLNEVRFRLSHYARMAAPARGLCLLKRTVEVVEYLAKRAGELSRLPFQLTENTDALTVHREQVRTVVYNLIEQKNSPIDAGYIGEIAQHVALPSSVIRYFSLADRFDHGRLCNLGFNILQGSTSGTSYVLIIYADAGVLSHWDRIEEDLDLCFTRGYRQLILVLSTGQFRALDFAGHSYLLSILLSSFPRHKFSTTLEVYLAPEISYELERRIFRFLRVLAWEIWQKMNEPHFSALIVSVEPHTPAR
jgi:hypothetical protein